MIGTGENIGGSMVSGAEKRIAKKASENSLSDGEVVTHRSAA
jgi:hypothetical protein